MKTNMPVGVVCAAFVGLASVSVAQAAPAACTLLSPAQISAAVGAQVGNGTPSTDTVCTWLVQNAENQSIKQITLTLQGLDAYNGGEQVAKLSSAIKLTPASAGGDGSYYLATGGQVGLIVKKGNVSFKVAVYASLPVDKMEAMELTLAKAVVPKI
jgi:hypothetical protein